MALVSVFSLLVIGLILLDGFEAMIVPRRASRQIRFTRVFYRFSWKAWMLAGRVFAEGKRRDNFLSLYGPLSILILVSLWASGLIVGFGCLLWSLDVELKTTEPPTAYVDYLYLSGVTFFTLGFGDITPASGMGRLISVFEAGTGFAFLAVVISYLPVLYQAFSKREVTISMLDARAGSPPTASELLVRLQTPANLDALTRMFEEWERWSAELLESHLSYPVLGFYRSQHDNQSWLAALATILDTSAILMTQIQTEQTYAAKLTFAMARHAAVDLSQHYKAQMPKRPNERLDALRWITFRAELQNAGWTLRSDGDVRLLELRALYEPFLLALGHFFGLYVPPILRDRPPVDNWQTSAWMRRAAGLKSLAGSDSRDDHEDG